MRIGILGQPTIDEIIHAGRRRLDPERALGGILYSYAAMERLMSERGSTSDTFVPLSWQSIPDRDFLETLLHKFQHMDDSEGVWQTNSLTNRVQLIYQENGHRSEHCPHILPPLTTGQITLELLESLDGLFINMISGFDVGLETLETALYSVAHRPYVHMDIHALVLGPLSQTIPGEEFGGEREPHGVPAWKRWLALADSVQMNELEARWLADPEIRSDEDLLRAIEQMDQVVRPTEVIITRAAKGASIYRFELHEAHHIPAPFMEVVETTGSGDVFGSAYIFFVLSGAKPEEALRQAVLYATWNSTLQKIDQIFEAPIVKTE